MAQKYAKDRPVSFTNRIERVAIVGASGQIGKPIAEALLQTGKHTVTALTRPDSTSAIPAGAKVARVDYADEAALAAALEGQQFLIITLPVRPAPDTHSKLVAAAAKAGVPYVMPNTYGSDPRDEKLGRETIIGPTYAANIRDVEEAGVSAWISLCCSFWYEFSLAFGPNRYNFDWENKRVKFYDDGTTKINTTTWLQCGRAVAGLLSLKELPEDENDTSPTVSAWRNRPLLVSSFLISQRDMLDSVNRVTGLTDADWTIESEPVKEQYAKGIEMLQGGDMRGFGIAMYSRVFFPDGVGDYESTKGLANGVLGLPKEDFDEATRRAVEMVESGRFSGKPLKLHRGGA